jgi:cation:H+ antiporter
VVILIQLSVGLVLLITGAEALVRGASRLAAYLGVKPLIIGLTIVAYGTSSPELAVSIQSGLAGKGDIAVGNVIGSNIFNVLFILGISALVQPLLVSRQLIRLDVPVMICVSILVFLFCLNGNISQREGGLLFLGALSYTTFLIIQARREKRVAADEFSRRYTVGHKKWGSRWVVNILFILVGLILLVVGSDLLIKGSVALAQIMGISELVIGLTIVAAGTSLPEVATSVMASIKGERDIAVGNVVGSNIFNILAVLGLASLLIRGGIPVSSAAIKIDIPVMIVVSVACLPIFFSEGIISRWEGLLFFGYYIVYTAFVIMKSSYHDMMPLFGLVFKLIIVPITLLTLLLISWQAFGTKQKEK